MARATLTVYPEFWGRIWEDETYVYAGVADGELPGWFERTIGGRYLQMMAKYSNSMRGVIEMHANAETQNMTLDDIFTWSADTLLMAVEYATLNSQTAVGNGCDSLYLQTHKVGEPALAGSTALKLPNALVSACVAGSVLDLGTTDGNHKQWMDTFISSADLDASDPLCNTQICDSSPYPPKCHRRYILQSAWMLQCPTRLRNREQVRGILAQIQSAMPIIGAE